MFKVLSHFQGSGHGLPYHLRRGVALIVAQGSSLLLVTCHWCHLNKYFAPFSTLQENSQLLLLLANRDHGVFRR